MIPLSFWLKSGIWSILGIPQETPLGMSFGAGLILADWTALLSGYGDVEEQFEQDLKGAYQLDARVYSHGVLTFAPRYWREHTYKAVLDGTLKDFSPVMCG